MDATERRELLHSIYSKEGLGLSVGRICIGSCDYSPEIYSYDDEPFDTELKYFSVKRDEKYIIPVIKEILEINPDIYLLASPWSPPYWMKTGGATCGGYMRDEYIDCYTDYVINFIQSYKEYGICISAVTPQNEPETHKNGQMPTCVWHPETEAKFICLLRQKLDKQGMDVKIWMYDHNFNGVDRVVWSLENCKGLSEACDGVSFHYYDGAIEQTRAVTKLFPGLKLHFTEGGPRLTQNYDTDWCKWGLMAVKALKTGYKSFMGFNIILDELGGPNVGPHLGICGGFVTKDSRNGTVSYSGQYRAFSHIAPYVNESSKIYSIGVSDAFNMCISKYPTYDCPIEGVLIDNGDGKKIAVIVNPNNKGFQTQIEINQKLWYVELHADCITTLIIE
jgi:glucosylceramidase